MAVAAHLNTTYCGLLKQPDNQKLATFRCKIELREASSAHSQVGGQLLSVGFRALPAIRQRVNGSRNSQVLRCQVPADVD